MKTKLFFAIVYCIFSITAWAQTTIPGGAVSGTWTKANSPYLIQGNVTIEGPSTLTIEPGTKIEFQGAYKFTAVGRLLAIGKADDSIKFVAKDPVTGWKGIRFNLPLESNDTSRLSYCLLRFARNTGDAFEELGGAFFFDHASKVVVSNSTITDCSAGVGAAIFCNKSEPTFISNKITRNKTSGFGTVCLSGSDPIVRKNIISYNTAKNGGAISCGSTYTLKIEGNFISNNTASEAGGGLYIADTVTVFNNLIVNNTAGTGGGIYCSTKAPLIMNNTVANNSSEKGGGVYFINTKPTLKNNILFGNTATASGSQLYIDDDLSDPTIIHSDIQDGKAGIGLGLNVTYAGIYQNNINANPSFINASAGSGTNFNGLAGDWQLNTGSPCINTGDPNGTYPGSDIAGNPRVINGTIDMGAYEALTTGIKNISQQSLFNLYPNPTNGQFTIESEKIRGSSIEIYNVLGEQIYSIQLVESKFTIDLREQPKGIYFIHLLADEKVSTKKIIIQ